MAFPGGSSGSPSAGLLDVQIDPKQLREIRLYLKRFPKAVAKVASRAINKTATFGRTRIVRGLARALVVKQTVLKARHVTLRRASLRRLWATITTKGRRRIPLIDFKARQTKRGVSYKIGKNARGKITSAFIASMKSGHRGVFARRGKTRLRIDERFGPSVMGVFERALHDGREIIREANTRLASEMERQVGVLLAKRSL